MTTLDNASKDTTGTADPLQLARDAFRASTTYFDASIRREKEQDIRQFQGVHPAGSKYHSDSYKTRSRIFRPKTRAAIRKNEATAAEALFSTRDVVDISAEDQDDPQARCAASVMKFLMEYRLKKTIPWFLTAMGSYQDAQAVGITISYQYWHYDKKRGKDTSCVELIPIENFRFDPGASWVDPVGTSPYLIRMIPMYVKDVRARMRPGQDNKPRWKNVDEAQLLQAARYYTDSTRLTRERGRTDSKEAITAITAFTIVWVHENVVEIDGEDKVYYTLGDIALLTDPVPLKQVYWHGVRPFVVGYSMVETHKNYPGGVSAITRDVQAEINDVANMRIDNWKYAMNKRYFVRRNGQVDLRSLTRNVPGASTLMQDPEKDVKVIDTNDVTSNAYLEQDRLNLDFDDLSGAFSPSSVQSNRKLNETVGGLDLISTNANQMGSYQLLVWVMTWVEPVLRQLMLLEAYYEDDQRLLIMAGQQARKDGFTLDAITDELMHSDLTLEVQVGMGAINPRDKVATFALAMKAVHDIIADGKLQQLGLDVAEVIKEVFGRLGYSNGKRFFDKQNDPTFQSLQGQIQELQQALSAKVNPELVAAQVRKLEADAGVSMAKVREIAAETVQKYVAAAFAAMQAGEVVTAIPQVSPVADVLLQNAGGMPGHQPVPTGDGGAPGLQIQPIENHKIGTAFTPGAAGAQMPGAGQPGGPMPGDTSPMTPANPASPMAGADHGINTMRADSMHPAAPGA